MTTEIITIYVSATVHNATELMRINHTNFIVVNRHNNADELDLVVMSLYCQKGFNEKPIAKTSQYILNHVKNHDLFSGQNEHRI